MNIILFDDRSRYDLLPFTHTRPVADIRCGIYTMRERWEYLLNSKTSSLAPAYLSEVFPLTTGADNLLINAAFFATETLSAAALSLKDSQKLVYGDTVVAARTGSACPEFETADHMFQALEPVICSKALHRLIHPWDIFSLNDTALRADFALLTRNRVSRPLPDDILVKNRAQVFLEEGAVVGSGCIINAATGPVYIGKGAEIMEGCLLRGPIAVCDHAVVKMGAKIYGATTLGPGCRAGGELSNVVLFANSNKGHDGFLGNSVIGEWCNLGADTNCSNLKNNYDEVKIWDEHNNRSVKTGLQFCGLLMGDHSKSGINTMFNTGTVVGVSANVFGGDFPEKFIPSFAWGGSGGMSAYDFDRAMETAARMMRRRNRELSGPERELYRSVFEQTGEQRSIFC